MTQSRISRCRGRHHQKRLTTYFGLALAALLIGSAASAVEYGGIGGRPAFPRPDNDRSKSIFVHTLNPGEQAEEGVQLLNNTDETKTLTVDAVDSLVSSGGGFACRQKVEPKTDVGSWIVLAKNEVTLEPMGSEIVPFTIQAPPTAGAGEHNGCVVIQEKNAAPQAQGNGITLSFRSGIRVAVMIPGDIVRQLEIAGFELKPRPDGNFQLSVRIRNTGNVSIDLKVDVHTRYFFGRAYAWNGGKFPALRGQTSELNFDLTRPFWGGWYRTGLDVTYDANQEAGIGKESGKELTVLRAPDITFFIPPQPLAAAAEAGAALAIIIVIVIIVIVFAKKQKIARTWVTGEVKEGEDIEFLAKAHRVSWKLLAKVNKLKPPYKLKGGDKLKVPPAALAPAHRPDQPMKPPTVPVAPPTKPAATSPVPTPAVKPAAPSPAPAAPPAKPAAPGPVPSQPPKPARPRKPRAKKPVKPSKV